MPMNFIFSCVLLLVRIFSFCVGRRNTETIPAVSRDFPYIENSFFQVTFQTLAQANA
jgi:hypothetical protein